MFCEVKNVEVRHIEILFSYACIVNINKFSDRGDKIGTNSNKEYDDKMLTNLQL